MTFTKIQQIDIPNLKITVTEYAHLATGARHFHLAADDDNNAFLIGFLTVPQDSTGVAHILEHTTLCGSQRYPVRDPFFMMARRSLNTFMNAFTSSDWTAYPFATQNAKDFNNLLQVYLDAVFFPKLDPLDFAQEGHRLEFSQLDDPKSPLIYKGVVFNEMKGAMSSPIRKLNEIVCAHLFPTITYHYNSGGDPQDIPKLSYEQLKQFHTSHYHPSNAVFMTYGNYPVAQHHELFETAALQHFQKQELNLHIPDEQRYSQPLRVVESYALDAQESVQDKTHIVLGWLLGKNTDLRALMNMTLLSGVLLDNSASPLRYVLETSELGTSPSQLCGFSDHTRETMFVCGLEGSNPEDADAVEMLILDVLQEVAEKGVPQIQVDSVLHQLELHQREITGDHFPYGLHLLVNMLSPALHGGDPITTLNIDAVLNQLREDCQNPQFIPNLVKDLLLNNPHRVRVVMQPDIELSARQQAEETVCLAALRANLSETDQQSLIDQAKALQSRQMQIDDLEILPKVTLADIPEDIKIPEGETGQIGNFPATWFTRSTNGMVYQAIVIDLPQFPDELVDLLPTFCDCLTEVGVGEEDYLQIAEKQALFTGDIHARISIRGNIDNVQQMKSIFALSSKALVRNQAKMTQLLHDTLEQARFDELPRLQELMQQMRADVDNSITDRGHILAMLAASSRLSPVSTLSHRWNGLQGIQFIRNLDEQLHDPAQLEALSKNLLKIRDLLLNAPRQFVTVSEAEVRAQMTESLTMCWQQAAYSGEHVEFAINQVNARIQQAWATNTQINFCAKAYPTVALSHADAPALQVLGNFLRNGYLHRAIREQGGAYGGGAGYNSDTGTFRFYSYRDPRLAETLQAFDLSLDWLQNTAHQANALEEAILGVISQIDRPGSPAGDAMHSFFESLQQRTPTQRREFRKQILKVTIEDLQRVAATYLRPEQAHVAVVSNAQKISELPPELGLEKKVI
jgi:presequence protease